jgi:hypothetical protein
MRAFHIPVKGFEVEVEPSYKIRFILVHVEFKKHHALQVPVVKEQVDNDQS